MAYTYSQHQQKEDPTGLFFHNLPTKSSWTISYKMYISFFQNEKKKKKKGADDFETEYKTCHFFWLVV